MSKHPNLKAEHCPNLHNGDKGCSYCADGTFERLSKARRPAGRITWADAVRVLLCAIFTLLAFEGKTADNKTAVLNLRNGDRLTGTIIDETTNQITFRSTWHNILVIPLAEIKSREGLQPAPAVQAPQPNVPIPSPAPTVISVPPVTAKKAKRWAGEAQMGLDLLFSERDRQLLSGRFKSTYSAPPLLASLDYQGAYGKTDGLISDNRMFGSVKVDWNFAKHLYAYTLGAAGYDEVARIDFRYEVGPGLGAHVLKTANVVLNVEGGGNYQVQFRKEEERVDSYYLRLAEDFTWKITSRLTWDEKFEFFPRVEHWEQYRFRAETNLRFALVNNLSVILTLMDQYDTQPARGVPQNILQLTSSIGVKF